MTEIYAVAKPSPKVKVVEKPPSKPKKPPVPEKSFDIREPESSEKKPSPASTKPRVTSRKPHITLPEVISPKPQMPSPKVMSAKPHIPSQKVTSPKAKIPLSPAKPNASSDGSSNLKTVTPKAPVAAARPDMKPKSSMASSTDMGEYVKLSDAASISSDRHSSSSSQASPQKHHNYKNVNVSCIVISEDKSEVINTAYEDVDEMKWFPSEVYSGGDVHNAPQRKERLYETVADVKRHDSATTAEYSDVATTEKIKDYAYAGENALNKWSLQKQALQAPKDMMAESSDYAEVMGTHNSK